MSFVSCGVNYETMYRKVANRITDKNTIISVLMTETQMMNDAFQAKIEEMKEHIIQLGVERKMTESKIDRLEQDMSRLGNKPEVKAYNCDICTSRQNGNSLRVVVEPTDTIFDVREKISGGLVRYNQMFQPVREALIRPSPAAAAKLLDDESIFLAAKCHIHMGNGVWIRPNTDLLRIDEKYKVMWDKCGSDITLSVDRFVASKTTGNWNMVTGGEPMTEGQHYWEVELTNDSVSGYCDFFVGAVRPGLDHNKSHHDTNDAYYISAYDGGLYGNNKDGGDPQGKFTVGDRIGMLLNLDRGWLRFYRNGTRCGSGFRGGVTGPLVRAGEMYPRGEVLTALPGAVAPLE